MEYRHKKKRRPNFTDPELMAMVSAVSKQQDILSGEFNLNVGRTLEAKKLKARAWRDVTDAVNTVSHVHRYTAEVRRKYRYFKCDTKRKKDFEKKLLRGKSALNSERGTKAYFLRNGVQLFLKISAFLGKQRAVHIYLCFVLVKLRSAVKSLEKKIYIYIFFLTFIFSEVKPHSLVSPKSEEPLDFPCSSAPDEGSAAEDPGPSARFVTVASPTPPSPTTNHLSPTYGSSQTSRTFNHHLRQCPGPQNSMTEMVEVQRQIRDLLQDINNTVATGFRDLAAAIRYAADKGSQTAVKDPVN
ncbi:hypothetical protein ACEWY4_019926 [Coilia grayii]|uniref:Myb/SANT-like DNA-binding domain-containing protein n=1 Tax=Coilia grayii TaxID=363190 RepID=A0ABD1JE98_9TELE